MARVLLGVSAGIAAYKAADLASALTQRGHAVITLMTPNAARFVTPLTFRAITRQRVYTDTFEDLPEAGTEHISLAQWGELFLIAPATADLIARLAAGMGDDVVTTTALAFAGPVVLAPAMNDRMWAHPLVGANLARLRGLGHRIVEPDAGYLACGSVGPGRLASPERLLEAVDAALAPR
jgi:phosphopantothenoylcysteine decarboxylase/phosphopantothenate--cysteine ligase